MRWDYHWDDIKESREYLKLAKKYNKLYLKSTSPIFTYKQENKYIDYEEVNIPNFDFIPSYDGMTDPFHLLHVHIPKCGGTTFERPLDIMKHWIMKTDGTGKSLISGKLSNKQLVDAVKEYKRPHSSFYCIHNTNWANIYDNQVVFCIIRNPVERLLSDIKHKARKWDNEKINQRIEEKNSDFDNLMYRHIYDFGTQENIVNFVDINDKNTLSSLKSTYLSSARLPNILQSSKFWVGEEREEKVKLSDEEVNNAFKKCYDKGYLEKDENIEFNYKKFVSTGKKINPTTIIIDKENKYRIIPTTHLFSKDFCLE